MFQRGLLRCNLRHGVRLANWQILHPSFSTNAPVVQEILNDQGRSLPQKRVNRRKPPIEPVAKNFFCGKVNTDILAFPEILNKEELKQLSQFTETIDSAINAVDKDVDSTNITDLVKSLNATSFNIPIDYGGYEMTITEISRIKEKLCQKFQLGLKIFDTLGYGVDEILQYVHPSIRQNLIPKILSGDCTPIICFHEKDINATNSFKTQAKLNRDQNAWVLNGEKIIYKNVKDNDVLMVLATTNFLNSTGTPVDSNTMFLVNANNSGVSKIEVSDNCYKLIFDNASIALDNMLGNQEMGLEIYLKAMITSRFSVSIACYSLLKDLLSKLSQTIINSDLLIENECVQEKVAEVACASYAMESMVYLTAGLLDGYENPDCTVESSILKVYSTEKCLGLLLSSVHIFGVDHYMTSLEVKNSIQSITDLQYIDESNDYLKILIGMLGLQHAGKSFADSVKKVRNPFMFPGFIFKKMLRNRHFESDQPKLTLKLLDYVHPSLDKQANDIEYCILKLQYVTEMLLVRNGREAPTKQMDINKLAAAVIEIYAMFATVSRASRSYCIGHHNAHLELSLANAVCKQGLRKVKDLLDIVETGPYNSSGSDFIKIAKQVFKSSGEFAEHSLKTNY